MKHLNSRWVAAALVAPVLLVLGVLLLAGSVPQAAVRSGKGIVQIAFTGTLTTSDGAPIAQEYSRVLLNVGSVRLNPSTNLNISEDDSNWATIAVPTAVGIRNPFGFINTNLNFGTSSTGTLIGTAGSVAQIDMEALQNLPYFFNSGSISAKNYNLVEIQLNSNSPGSVTPLCPHSLPSGEGCISYPVTLATTSQGTATRVRFANPYTVSQDTVQPLVINIQEMVGLASVQPVIKPGQAVTIVPAIVPMANSKLPNSNTPFNPALGVVKGTITNGQSSTTVTAEYSGTNQIVASTKLVNNKTFLLSLPAETAPNSTLYDFYVSGSGGYVVRSRVALSSSGNSGQDTTVNLGNLTVPTSTFTHLGGNVSDDCSGTSVGIQAATLQLLVPDTSNGGGSNCELVGTPLTIPSNCVVVATAQTDDVGHYPLPSTNKLPQAFAKIPITPPSTVPFYDLVISASGFNTSVQRVEKAANNLKCPDAGFNKQNACNFALEHGYMQGAPVLASANNTGNSLDFLVMAEDSGTNQIENLALPAVLAGETTGSTFTMPVPDAAPTSARSIPVANYDVFASVMDLFNGVPQKTSGHMIATASSVGAPADDCSTLTLPADALFGFDCVGMGSVFGTVNNANPNTTSVMMSQNSVDIMQTDPNSIGVPPNGNNYNFCAPAQVPYVLTHFENGEPVAGASVPVTLPTPITVGTPCATICNNSQTNGGNRCLLCQPTVAPPLP